MKYIMSLDGGGSKLLCLIADMNGNLLGTGRSGPTNANFSSREAIENSVRTAVLEAILQNGIDGRDIGIVHSATLSYDREWMTGLLQRHFNCHAEVHSQSEYELSLFGAIQEDFGALVQSGTGSFAMVRTERGYSVVGGKGAIAGDEGSGFYIGHKLLVSSIHMEDGLGPATLMREKLLEHMNVKNTWAIVSELNSMPVDCIRLLIASFCPLTGVCVKEGDEEAMRIIRKAGEHLAKHLLAVLKKAGAEASLPVTVSGGAWKTDPLLFRCFREYVLDELPQARIIPPVFEPAAGGILLGLRDSNPSMLGRMDELKKSLSGFAYPPELFN